MIDAGTHVGRSALIEGAIIGRACDIRDHVRIQEGAAIGDEVTIGSESSIAPHVRIYPYKEVETGLVVYENLIWETRASRLPGRTASPASSTSTSTPETGRRLATALGTALKRGARVVASRDSAPGCRMIKRAMISGLNAAGVDVADLRVSPPAVSRHVLKTPAFAAPSTPWAWIPRPEAIFIRIYEPPGSCSPGLQKEIERNFTARSCGGSPRAASAPSPTRRASARATRRTCSTSTPRRSASGTSGSSSTTATRPPPSCCRSWSARSASRRSPPTASSPKSWRAGVARPGDRAHETARDGDRRRSGRVFDQSGERLYLVDEQGHEVPVDQTLLLYVRLLAERGDEGKVAFPVTVTSKVEELAGTGSRSCARRTRSPT